MRALVFNHTFDQDLDSLQRAAGDSVEWRHLELDLLYPEVSKVIPQEIVDGAEAYAEPRWEENRRQLGAVLTGLFEDLYRDRAFDLFVTPSDIFYYLRPAPAALHRLGVPFFVAERETTVSPHIMREHVELVKRSFPPIADHRTLCSERIADFWVQVGAPRDSISVTGQPRFDFYRRPERWPERLPYGDDGPVALFLAYDYNAYHPDGTATPDIWADQHRQTEEQLWELARRGWRVLFKPHPQQERSDRARLKEELGSLFGDRVFFVTPAADTRELIVGADVVIGFQTSALIEAMVARKPVVYAGWHAEAERVGSALIPFREWGDVVNLVPSPEDLVPVVERARGTTYDERAEAVALAATEEHLGVCDGHAADRVLAAMRRCVDAARSARTSDVEERRRRLERRPPPLRLRRRTLYGYRRARRRAGALLGR